MKQANVYVHSDDYHHALDELVEIARSYEPEAPSDLRGRIIEAIGDLGVWPMEVFNGQDEGEVIVAA